MESPRWNVITPSQYEWERRGLDFIKAGLPDHDPYRAWANFEFQTSDGAIYEIDLLVLTKQGFWLVECKAWGGRIYGDSGTWTRSQDGKLHSEDNPVLLANRKAKALSSLLKAQPAVGKIRVPWLDALVFLSADDVQCDLTGAARNRVLLKNRPADPPHPERKGILAALINREALGIDRHPRDTVDIKVAKALARAMEQAGIRPQEWPTVVRHGLHAYPGRLVAVKRERWSACLERRAVRKRASKKQRQPSRTALFLAGYFFVWTDVPAQVLDAVAVLAWYRCRWQIETDRPHDTSSERWCGHPAVAYNSRRGAA